LAALTIGLCTSFLARSGKSSSSSSAPVVNGTHGSGNPTFSDQIPASSYPSPSAIPSRTLKTCLQLFSSSAPTSPLSYPCSDCVPLLSSTANDYNAPLSDGNATGVGAALQFCAMNDVFRDTNSNVLQENGWMKDGSPCTWSGVTCDARGRITEL
jgi:hypothetical protein